MALYSVNAAVTIDVMELLLGLLIVAGVAALVVLIIFIARLIGTLSRVNKLIDDVHEPVRSTVKQLPETMKTVNVVMGNVQDLTDDVTETMPDLLEDVVETTDALKLSLASVSLTVNDLAELLSNWINLLRGKTTSTASKVSGIVSSAASAAGAYAGARRRRGRKRK